MNIQNIPLHLIDPHPAQPREKLTGIDSLADSITECGVRHPIVVRVSPFDSSRYQIESGHRRVAAAAKAGLTEIPAVVFVDDDEMSVLALLATQSQHVPFTEKEAQKGLQGVLSFGNVERTGKALGLDPAKIRAAQRGYSLIDKSKIAQASFDELVILSEFEDDPATRIILETAIGKGSFRWKAEAACSAKQHRIERDALIATGITVLEKAPGRGVQGINPIAETLDAAGAVVDQETCKACPAVCLAPKYSSDSIDDSYALYCDTSKAIEGHHYRFGSEETPEQAAQREAIAKARQERIDAHQAAKNARLDCLLNFANNDSKLLMFVTAFACAFGLRKEGDQYQPAMKVEKGDRALQKLMVLAVNEAEDKIRCLENRGGYDEFAAKNYGPPITLYFDFLKDMAYVLNPPEIEILSWLEKPKKEKKAKKESTVAPESDTDPACVACEHHIEGTTEDCEADDDDERPEGCPNAPIACDEACEQNDLDGIGCTLTETDTVPEVCPKQGNLYAGEIKMLIARTNGNGAASTKYTAPFDTKHVTYTLEIANGLATLCIFDEPDLDAAKADAAAVAQELGIDFGAPKVTDGSDTVFEAAIA